ncbi:glycerol-3-phosphate dehydrogenase [Conyzicola lurida]|uniref:Glycerol-3-phosphate dehydrogenase n=1 Tax=Conyzicola lurida TaxID=1172621 RepID=A0A841AM53_9MICO|nr:glycerol-3-phosphate dehydrogenase [Conyzicola lurida]
MKSSESMPTGDLRHEVAALIERPKAQVLVIGGGINGIATFRDLALQGVDVVLVERSDYCSGASAASSHMIHGGVRYLENGEFRLVRESVTERNGLLRIAPHYVKPLQTTIPIYSTFSGILSAPLRFLTHKSGAPKERGALLIKVGLVLYDSFSRDGGSVPRHTFVGRKKALKALPSLNPGVKYTATYFDASVHEPERLALDVLRDGLAAGDNARSSNYVEAVGSTAEGVLLRDMTTGREFTIDADVVVNASGPWTDLTNEALGDETAYMGGTKGSHIVLDNPALLEACAGREMFFEHKDGRIVLIYPLNGKVMVGTTDLEADIREPAVCTDEEIDYFFDLVANVFPSIPVSRDQIVYSFSGVRPLPRHDDMQPGFVSRDYRIVAGKLGRADLLSLVGGKWTTFRALAEHISTDVLALLGSKRTVDTKNLEIGGGRGYPRTDEARDNWITAHSGFVGKARAAQLFDRYGTRAVEVLDAIDSGEDAPLRNSTEFSLLEVEHIVATESVVHMSDLLLRRTNLAFTGDITVELLEELVEIAAGVLGWTQERQADEIRQTVALLADSHNVHIAHAVSVSN